MVDLTDLDAFEAGRAWPLVDELRAREPLHWNDEPAPQNGFWSVTRHADVGPWKAYLGILLRREDPAAVAG